MRAKRIFLIGDFKDEKPQSVYVDERKLLKGFIRLGHDVQHFSYRNVMMQASPFAKKRWGKGRAKRKADKILVEQVRYYFPDIVVMTSLKHMDGPLVQAMRQAAPGAILLGRDGDPYPQTHPNRLEAGRYLDIVLMPNSGKFLEAFKNAGAKHCAFLPFAVDPDILYRHENPPAELISDVVFTGTAEHGGLPHEDDRYDILCRLRDYPRAKLFGCFGHPKTQGLDCFRALSASKIGLSINIANDVRLYHSDRFVHIPACGTFMLAKRVPGYELMFEDGIHCRYFDTVDEFFELVDWYLEHEDEREKIAQAGMQRAYEQFNCTKVAGHLVDLAMKGSYDAPWAETL